MFKKSKWGKVREFVFTRPKPTTSAWSRVDMHVLFPDLYQPKETVTTMMAGRVVPPTSNIKNNRQIYIASQSVGFYSMHFLSKTPTIALGFGNGKFNIHDLNTTKRCHTVEVSPDNMPVTCIRDYLHSDVHRIVAGTADGWVKGYTFDLEEGLEEVSAINVDSAIYSLDTSDNYHICALDTRQIQVLDALRGEYVRDVGRISTDEYSEEEEVGHQQRVTCVRFRPGNPYQCVSAGWDRSVYLWDIRMEPHKAAVRCMKGPKICGDGLDMQGDILLSASFATENALQMWDLGSGNLIKSIKYKETEKSAEYLYSCRFVDSSRVVAGGSGSRDAKVINTKTGVIEGVFYDTKPIHSVGYQGGKVAAGGISCYVHVGDFSVDEVI